MIESRETREFETVDMQLNMGPQHPSTHGVFRMILGIDGERIVDCEPIIGYLHRGVEKLSEDVGFKQVIPLFDRLDYLGSLNNEHAYVMALEKLMGIEVPEKAEYIRVILLELNRIASHLVFYGAFGADSGALTPFLYAFREREKINFLFESVTGGRLTHNYMRVGGVKDDVPSNFKEMVTDLLKELEKGIIDYDRLLSGNEIFMARTKSIGVISREDAISYALSGPMGRASGIEIDIRKEEPYSVYDRFDFDVPVGKYGDCYERYVLRIEEMRQSIRIIKQAIEQFPDTGEHIHPKAPKNLRPPVGEVYLRTENPRGEFGVYLVSQGGLKPYRVKIRGGSFCNLSALQHLLRNTFVADIVLVLGSIDITLGEVDR